MLSSDKARPNWVMPSPLVASSLDTRKIECFRLAMVLQIALQDLEIGKCALGWDKAKLHQSAGGVIDEHQKRAGRRRSSNQRWSEPSIWISSPKCSRRWSVEAAARAHVAARQHHDDRKRTHFKST